MAKDFMSVYKKRYDPKAEGFGSPSDWKKAFKQRMSTDEAKRIVKDQSPFEILEVESGSAFDIIKRAFRKLAMLHHPDKHPGKEKEATERMQKIIAAFTLLKEKLGKK